VQADQASDAETVFKRQVFYIPGFDPFPPRRYRELYRREAAEQARLSGYSIALQPGYAGPGFGWRVTAQIEGRAVETDMAVLVWSDIVQGGMAGGIGATYRQMAQTVWLYLASGALFRLMLLRKGPVIAALYPPLMLTAQLALALGIGGLIWQFGRDFAGGWIAGLAGVTAVWGILQGFRRIDRYLFAWYLMHDYAFVARGRGAYTSEMEARIDAFRATVSAALRSGVDEVLVVGHSSGAYVAVSVLADLLRAEGDTPPPNGAPVLSLLTLGQVVPMVSFLPGAARLRGDLRLMSQGPVPWVDVTARR
jgi:hypothetical protein